MPEDKEQYVQEARRLAEQLGIDPTVFIRLINQESGFRHFDPMSPDGILTSSSGAKGIGQIMPATAKGLADQLGRAYTEVIRDPLANLEAAAQYLSDALQRYGGDYKKAIASYNAGGPQIEQYGLDTVLSPEFAGGQTMKFVQNILGPEAPPPTTGGNDRLRHTKYGTPPPNVDTRFYKPRASTGSVRDILSQMPSLEGVPQDELDYFLPFQSEPKRADQNLLTFAGFNPTGGGGPYTDFLLKRMPGLQRRAVVENALSQGNQNPLDTRSLGQGTLDLMRGGQGGKVDESTLQSLRNLDRQRVSGQSLPEGQDALLSILNDSSRSIPYFSDMLGYSGTGMEGAYGKAADQAAIEHKNRLLDQPNLSFIEYMLRNLPDSPTSSGFVGNFSR